MNKRQEQKLAAMNRAHASVTAHADDSPGYAAMVTMLGDTVTRAREEHQKFLAGQAASAEGAAARKAVRTRTHRRYLMSTTRLKAQLEVTNPDVARLLNPPASDATYEEWRAGAHTVLDAVTRFPDVMAAHGMRATFGADLAGELAKYDAAVAEMDRGHLEHVRATSTIRQALSEGMRLLKVFDAINRHRFAGQPELLVEWESARNVAWERGGKAAEEETPDGEAQGGGSK